MTQNHYQWISALVLPRKVYGILGYTGVECQLGSVVRSPEQVNYAHYNQGFRNNQTFYIQNPQNLFKQQTTPPGFVNNQRVPQKSNLELLLENLVLDQTKHNQEFKIQAGILNDSIPDFANNRRVPQKSGLELLLENLVLDNARHNQEFKNKAGILNDSFVRLSSKVDSLCTHNKTLETQIPQVASSSQTSEVFPSQTETNPKGPKNAITLRDGKQLKDPVVETKTIEVVVESEKARSEKFVVESEKPNTPPTYKPKIPFPIRV